MKKLEIKPELKIITDRIKEILTIKEVLAIFQNGSIVVNVQDEQSDIDFIILVKAEEGIGKVIDIVKRNFKSVELDSEYPFLNLEFNFRGKKLDFSIFSKKNFDNFVANLYKNKQSFLKLQNTVQHKVIEAIEIYDPKNLLKKYKKSVINYPEDIRQAIIKDSLVSLESIYDTWCYEGFRNDFQYIFYLDKALENICLALYAKNKKFAMLPYKRLHKDLKDLKPNIEREVYTLMQDTNSKNNLEKKKKALKKIIDKLRK